MIPKYEVGDWFYDNKHGRDHFWKIREIHIIKEEGSLRKCIGYNVALMKYIPGSLEFRFWGGLCVEECELHQVINIVDIMKCKISDVQSAYLEAQKEADRLKADLDCLLRTRELLL